MIELSSVRKSLGGRTILQDVGFVAPNGAITGLLGANGAGKTTTLRCLGGLLQPDAGEVRISGEAAGRRTRGRLGVLPESAGLSPRLTARENIAYAGELHGLRGRALGEAVDRVIAELAIEALADRRALGFSQGERRRVAIARALVHDPENVVLDEPTVGLDVMSARRLRDVMCGLAASGRAVLLATHVLHDAATLCDQVVVMARGRVVRQDEPQRLLQESGAATLEDAFVHVLGTEEGVH